MSTPHGKLRLGALVALVVGSMIGGGIFSLPQNMAASAEAGAVLIGWAITAIGMLTLAFVFQTLANRKPDLDGGVYVYAKAGFGDYMGFSSAWGYWISAWLGNVGYFVLLFSTLDYFFPVLGGQHGRSNHRRVSAAMGCAFSGAAWNSGSSIYQSGDDRCQSGAAHFIRFNSSLCIQTGYFHG